MTNSGTHLFPGPPAVVAELRDDPEDAAGRHPALVDDVDRAGNERGSGGDRGGWATLGMVTAASLG